jgi:hypothetical protein
MTRALLAATPALLALLLQPAHAGRPLSTDDAGTADPGTCQVESWHEKAGSERAFVLAPACGVVPGVEIGVDSTWPKPRDVVRQEAGLAVKFVPASWKVATGAGELNFGLKASGAWLKPADAGWQSADTTVLGLATWKPADSLAVHVNVGISRDRASATRATLTNAALVWTPHEPLLVFVEAQGNNKKDVFGGTVSTVGARWWLVKDTLGLDLTASRESGGGSTTRWTFGIGWYGIGS